MQCHPTTLSACASTRCTGWSTRLEGGVLIVGLVVIYLTADDSPERAAI